MSGTRRFFFRGTRVIVWMKDDVCVGMQFANEGNSAFPSHYRSVSPSLNEHYVWMARDELAREARAKQAELDAAVP